ncbi:MAG: NADH-quinone oxidoreductase chain 2 [Alphaproteobacteria bacterium MarineAlpha9_Bin7]|nr:MAG: NADH-quinone oxidoreductase chain 2 [Alphaproteobacteria bacterium MarineAlpha9_Bin7]
MTKREFATKDIQPTSFFFNGDNKLETEKIISQYPDGKQASALLPLLDLAQRQQGGWLPQVAIRYVASLLDVPEIRAFEVASFYTMFNLSPRGKFLIQFCRTTPCWLRGGDDVRTACSKHLGIGVGETTSDGLFTLMEVECLGACVNAPIIQINDDYYEDLDPGNMAYLLDSLRTGVAVNVGTQNPNRRFSEPEAGLTTLNEI